MNIEFYTVKNSIEQQQKTHHRKQKTGGQTHENRNTIMNPRTKHQFIKCAKFCHPIK